MMMVVAGGQTAKAGHQVLVVVGLLLLGWSTTLRAEVLFRDDFRGNSIDTTKWTISNGRAPGANPSFANTGTFESAHATIVDGEYLRLELTQEWDAGTSSVLSKGGEIASISAFGYGTFEWRARAASEDSDPKGTDGRTASGCVSGLFNYATNSITEIDFESQGQSPSTLEYTTWNTESVSTSSSTEDLTTLSSSFHTYSFVWTPTKVDYYLDFNLMATHHNGTDIEVPSTPAHALINLWGTNNTGFGGVATLGSTRYLYVDYFKYSNDTSPPQPSTASSVRSAWSALLQSLRGSLY